MTHLDRLEQQIGSLQGKKILDIGSGLGSFLITCSRRGYSAVGIELNPEKIEKSHTNARQAGVSIHVQQGVGEKMPFEDRSFDFINASELLEHVQNPREVLAEIHRLLRPSGFAYMSVHNRFGFKDQHFRIPFINWMPRSLAERILTLFNMHGREYHYRSGLQRITEMHYFTFRGFKRIAREANLSVLDIRIEKLKKKFPHCILVRFTAY
jgi:2-polyprenyl-3-methyl-5-hydroxy-6-metoxy-1,4-benzoquinol methylase